MDKFKNIWDKAVEAFANISRRNKILAGSLAAVVVLGLVIGITASNLNRNSQPGLGFLGSGSSGSSDDTSERASALISDTNETISEQEAASKAAKESSSSQVASVSIGSSSSSGGGGGKSGSSSSVQPTTNPITTSHSSGSSVSVTSVDFSRNSVTLTVGHTYQLMANITPPNATNQSLSWTSTNSAVASVNSSGGITARKAGTALIRATNPDGQRDTCTVTVVAASGGGSSSSGGSGAKGISGVTLPSSPVDLHDQTKTFDGVATTLHPGPHCVDLGVNTSSVNMKYPKSDLIIKVYKDGALIKTDDADVIGTAYTTSTDTIGLSCYVDNGYWWLTPATYRFDCYAGAHLFETISFSVNELGFTS